MNTTQRTVLLALVFALIASTLLAVDTDAKRKRKHKQRENRASIVREVPNERASLIDSDILTQPVNRDLVNPPAINPDILNQPVNPDILNPPAARPVRRGGGGPERVPAADGDPQEDGLLTGPS